MSGREPRPISTSRQPVLPLMVSSRPPSLGAPESGASSSFSLRGGLARAFVLAVDASARSEDLDPSGPVLGLVRAAIETDDFRAAQAAGEADRQDRLVAQASQIVVERRQHRAQVVGEDRFFLDGRSAMGASNAGEHGRDVPIARVQRFAELAIAPANPREAPLQRRDGNRLLSAPAVDAGGEIQPDGLRIRGQGVKTLAAQPGGKLSPIGVVSALGVFGARVAGVIARLFAERREMRRGVPLRDGRGRFRLHHPTLKRRFLPTWALGGLNNSDSVSRIPIRPVSPLRSAGLTIARQISALRSAITVAKARHSLVSAANESGHSSGVLAGKIRRLGRLSTDQTRNFSFVAPSLIRRTGSH